MLRCQLIICRLIFYWLFLITGLKRGRMKQRLSWIAGSRKVALNAASNPINTTQTKCFKSICMAPHAWYNTLATAKEKSLLVFNLSTKANIKEISKDLEGISTTGTKDLSLVGGRRNQQSTVKQFTMRMEMSNLKESFINLIIMRNLHFQLLSKISGSNSDDDIMF